MSLTEIALYLAAGMALGGLYLGALWLTVARLGRTRRPLAVLAASALLRIAALLAALALLTGLDWRRLAACLAGMLVARLAATAWPGAAPARGGSST